MIVSQSVHHSGSLLMVRIKYINIFRCYILQIYYLSFINKTRNAFQESVDFLFQCLFGPSCQKLEHCYLIRVFFNTCCYIEKKFCDLPTTVASNNRLGGSLGEMNSQSCSQNPRTTFFIHSRINFCAISYYFPETLVMLLT